MKYFHLSIIFLIAFSPFYLYSQSYILIDKETKGGIPFAKIYFDNNSKTISNSKGEFNLDLEAISFIVSHPLYEKDTFKIDESKFWLTPNYQDVAEVTVKNIDYYKVYKEKLKKNKNNEYQDTIYGESTRFRRSVTKDDNDTCSCMEKLSIIGIKNGNKYNFFEKLEDSQAFCTGSGKHFKMIDHISRWLPSESDLNNIIAIKKKEYDLGEWNFKGRSKMGGRESFSFSEHEIRAKGDEYEFQFIDTINVQFVNDRVISYQYEKSLDSTENTKTLSGDYHKLKKFIFTPESLKNSLGEFYWSITNNIHVQVHTNVPAYSFTVFQIITWKNTGKFDNEYGPLNLVKLENAGSLRLDKILYKF
jgi:hypothetical protein